MGPALAKELDQFAHQRRAPEPSWRVRLYVRLHTAALDERLADGANPLSSQPLALRARQLAEARTRHSLAVAIDTLVQDAHRPAPNVRATVRFDEATVRTVVTDLRALAERLRDRRPVAERGVAMTSVLLRDGCGPVYDRHAPLPLSYSVRIARLCLDP